MTEITATRLTGIKATETNASTSLFFIFIKTTISVKGGQIVVLTSRRYGDLLSLCFGPASRNL
ncbi:hypothetical protein H0Z09_06880 [Pseudomonas sp. SWRI18]|uniref:hypothetical protein n=1 Tax=Pseudomonas TaxID=286 RepID=UPI00138FBC04|nr:MULTISPECIES: hypothetical protein [Pseudomonas]MBC3300838.1 hypothetical protein [Pseudomonas sp. SWRI18]